MCEGAARSVDVIGCARIGCVTCCHELLGGTWVCAGCLVGVCVCPGGVCGRVHVGSDVVWGVPPQMTLGVSYGAFFGNTIFFMFPGDERIRRGEVAGRSGLRYPGLRHGPCSMRGLGRSLAPLAPAPQGTQRPRPAFRSCLNSLLTLGQDRAEPQAGAAGGRVELAAARRPAGVGVALPTGAAKHVVRAIIHGAARIR